VGRAPEPPPGGAVQEVVVEAVLGIEELLWAGVALADSVAEPEVLEAFGSRHEEQQVHARVGGRAEGVRGVRWHQQEVAVADGDDPLPGQDVEAAFDDEEDLGRAGVIVGRWPVRALA
jgi:hypothetical protein